MTQDRLKEAFEEGYRAFQDGLGRYDNPYDQDAQAALYEAWQEGFYAAGWDD